MSALLVVAAWLEAVTGLVLLIAPSLLVSILLGAPLDTSSGAVLARVAGAALLSLALICWLARNDQQHQAKRLIKALLLYNATVVAVLIHAYAALGLSGIGLWPAVVVHIVLAGWCVRACLPWGSSRRVDGNFGGH